MPIGCREMPLLLMNDYYKMLLPKYELSGGPYSVFTLSSMNVDVEAPACFANGSSTSVSLEYGRYEGNDWEYWNSLDLMPVFTSGYQDLRNTFPQRSWNLSGCTLSAHNFYDQYWRLTYFDGDFENFFGKISPSGECIGLSSLNIMPFYGYARMRYVLYDDHTYRISRDRIHAHSKVSYSYWSEQYGRPMKFRLDTVNPYFPHALERGGRSAYTSRYYTFKEDRYGDVERDYALVNQNLMRPQNSDPYPVSSLYDPAFNEQLYDWIREWEGYPIFLGTNSIWDDYTIQNKSISATWKNPPTTIIRKAQDWGYDLKQMIDNSEDGVIYKSDRDAILHLAWNRDKMNWLKDFDVVRIYWNAGMIDHSIFQAGALYEEGRFIFGFKEKALDKYGNYEVEYYRPQ